jgi:hypothetical protein
MFQKKIELGSTMHGLLQQLGTTMIVKSSMGTQKQIGFRAD